MLTEKQIARARSAIETMYVGSCTVVERRRVERENRSTGFEEVVVVENQPCRLCVKLPEAATETEGVTYVVETAKIFLPPEVEIRPGAKIIVTQNGKTTPYKNSGRAVVFCSHQEVKARLFHGWA